jgi:hypothetical protein
MSGKEFPNNYDALSNAPSEAFAECSWEDFVEWKIMGWDMPSSVYMIIRAQHVDSYAITEHVYQKPGAARNRVLKYMQDGEHDLVLCTHDSVSLLTKPDSPHYNYVSDTEED